MLDDGRRADEQFVGTAEFVGGASGADEIQLSVVVPTYNEEASVVATLDALYDSATVPPDSFEVVVVDESTDATPEVIRDLDRNNLRLVRPERSLGLSRSVVLGFRRSRGAYLGVIDADGQHPPSKLFGLFETAREGDCDVVVASRYVSDGGIENWSRYRWLVSRGATALVQLVLLRDRDIADPLSGFFVVRSDLLDGIALDPVGYKILLEILVRADPDTVVEEGYVFADREEGESNLDAEQYLRFLRHVWELSRA